MYFIVIPPCNSVRLSYWIKGYLLTYLLTYCGGRGNRQFTGRWYWDGLAVLLPVTPVMTMSGRCLVGRHVSFMCDYNSAASRVDDDWISEVSERGDFTYIKSLQKCNVWILPEMVCGFQASLVHHYHHHHHLHLFSNKYWTANTSNIGRSSTGVASLRLVSQGEVTDGVIHFLPQKVLNLCSHRETTVTTFTLSAFPGDCLSKCSC